MKITIFYHSGTGNTELTARLMEQDLLKKEGVEVSLSSIENTNGMADLELCDGLILGFPVYYGEPSPTMQQFLKALPRFAAPKYTFLFATCGLFPAGALEKAEELCREKNLLPVYCQSYRCPATDMVLLTPDIPFFYTFEREYRAHLQRDVVRALRFFRTPPEEAELSEKKKLELPKLPQAVWSLLAERKKKAEKNPEKNISPTKKGMVKLYPLEGSCRLCGRCVENCPNNSFSFGEKGVVWSGDTCMSCLRCVHGCPEKALSIKKGKEPVHQLTPAFYQKKYQKFSV